MFNNYSNKIKTSLKNLFFNKNKNYKLNTNSGFSLIELVVVIAIMTIISGVTLFNQGKFSGNVSLENLAYEIALTIRQAQFFGMNVREVTSGGSSTFDSGYGVFFDKSNPNSFIFFADLNNNRFYDGAGEVLEVYNMTRGNYIKYLCIDGGCADPSTSTINDLAITFKRPDPDALIKTSNTANCGAALNSGCGIAEIIVGSPRNNVTNKTITIMYVGQISVSN